MRIGVLAATAVLVSCLVGCTDAREWSYEADAPTVRAPVLAKRVVVPPLNDLRSSENDNMFFIWIAFPLVPYDSETYHRPERLHIWEFYGFAPCDPVHDVAKAIADELDHSGLFTEVAYSPAGDGGELILKGDLIALSDKRWKTLYGLGWLGLNFLLVGAPIGQTTHELTLKLTLVEADTGTVLWSKTFNERDKQTEWVYATDFTLRHPGLLKTELRQAIGSMETALTQ